MIRHRHPVLISARRVYKLFSTHTPKNMEQVIEELGDEIYDLNLDGESLYKFIINIKGEGNLRETKQGYLLTVQGQTTLYGLEEWIADEIKCKSILVFLDPNSKESEKILELLGELEGIMEIRTTTDGAEIFQSRGVSLPFLQTDDGYNIYGFNDVKDFVWLKSECSKVARDNGFACNNSLH